MQRKLVVIVLGSFLLTGCVAAESGQAVPTKSPQNISEEPAAPTPTVGTTRTSPSLPYADTWLPEAVDGLSTDDGWPAGDTFETSYERGLSETQFVHCDNAEIFVETSAGDETREFGPTVFATAKDDEYSVAMVKGANGYNALEDIFTSSTWVTTGDKPVEFENVEGEYSARATCKNPELETLALEENSEPFTHFVWAAGLLSGAEDLRVHNGGRITDIERNRLRVIFPADGNWTRQLVERLLALEPPSRHEVWGDALEWTKEQGHDDLTYELYRHWQPVGRCSHDSRPQWVRKEFAEFCHNTGRKVCSLALQTELLAYRIPRRSDLWMGGKPVSYTSPIGDLPEEVQVPAFMLGLLVQYPDAEHSETAYISTRFFALSVIRSTWEDDIRQKLETWLGDESIDTWNRHRFAIALMWLDFYAEPERDFDGVKSDAMKRQGVPEITRHLVGEK